MNEFNGLPDDLDELSKQNLEQVAHLFGRTVERNQKELVSQPSNTPINMPIIKRETVINKDDLTNLQILLGQTQTIDEFIKNM